MSVKKSAKSEKPETIEKPEISGRLLEIKTAIVSHDLATMAGVWAIGKLLTEAKSLLEHGEFTPFVVREFGWSGSYAARLMRLYREYPEGLPEGLGISTLLSTLTLDEQIRNSLNEIIKKAELTQAEAALLVEKTREEREVVEELRRVAESPEEAVRIKAELRAALESEVKSELVAESASSAEELAELERINAGLQSSLAEAEAARKSAEAIAAEAGSLRSQVSTINRELIAAREIAEAARAERDVARASAAEAAEKAKNVKTVEKVVEKIVPPSDYEETKKSYTLARQKIQMLEASVARNAEEAALVDGLRAQVERFRSSAEGEVVKKAELLGEVRRLRARVAYLENQLTEAGVEFEAVTTTEA